MRTMRSFLLAIAASTALATSAHATEFVTVSAGVFDIDDIYESGLASIEYRGERFWHGLLPIAGVAANTDGGAYVYGGFNYDFDLGDRWVLTPSLAVAAYHEGDSRDLGGVIEFQSRLGLDYRFENESRLGLSIAHLSNAGIYDDNPGAEMVMLNYSIPVNVFK